MKKHILIITFSIVALFLGATSEWWLGVAMITAVIYGAMMVADSLLFKQDIYTTANQPAVISAVMQLSPLVLLPFLGVEIVTGHTAVVQFFVAGLAGMVGLWFYFRTIVEEADTVTLSLLWNLMLGLVPALAFVFADERLAGNQYIGILLIAAGATVAIWRKESEQTSPSAALSMIFAVVFMSASAVLMKVGYEGMAGQYASDDVYWTGVVFRALGYGLVGFILYLFIARENSEKATFWDTVKRYWPLLIALEVMQVVADMLSALATKYGDVSIVTSVDGLIGLFTMTVTTIMLVIVKLIPGKGTVEESLEEQHDEQVTNFPQKLAGTVLIIIGAYLVS